jgi:hypothetical protein
MTIYPSYNVAKTVLEFSISIPRDQLRPGYGDGFLGAPLKIVQPPAPSTTRDRGGHHEPSRIKQLKNSGGQKHV